MEKNDAEIQEIVDGIRNGTVKTSFPRNPIESPYKAMLDRIRQKAAGRGNIIPMPKPEDGISCAECGGTGWVEVVEDGHRCMTHCPKCWARRKVARMLKSSGINPDDYKRYNLRSFDRGRSPEAAKMADMALRYINEHERGGQGFGVFGGSGMGKTHICIAVCLALTQHFGEAHHYFSYRAEIPALVKAARSYSQDYDDAMARWKSADNLYIDDLFKLSGRVQDGHLVDLDREELRVVFDLINARYVNHKTTIFSGEYSIKDISQIDMALGSRIYQMIEPYGLYVSGKNQRI